MLRINTSGMWMPIPRPNIGSMVLRMIHRPVPYSLHIIRPVIKSFRCLYSTQKSQPLRILFCGSDPFSCASLRAVHQEQLRDHNSIASIDVLVRPGKLSGRGMKSKREVPIKCVAQELGLTVHERDTFTGWTLPQPNGELINLIIAVSFGLFVPLRILTSAEYGGINVHPSLLPDFRGAAPLHHTLLAGETHTGVTLQTLHPAKFDHGTILAQTPPLEIPNASQCTYQKLLEFITPKAADILVQGIRDRLFIIGPDQIKSSQTESPLSLGGFGHSLRHAPKIKTEDRNIEWTKWSVEDILRRDRVLGRLWTSCELKGRPNTRIVLEGLEDITQRAPKLRWYPILDKLADTPDVEAHTRSNHSRQPHNLKDPGKLFLLPVIAPGGESLTIPCVEHGEAIVIGLRNGNLLLVKEITMEGSKKTSAAKILADLTRSGEIEERRL